MVHKRASRCVTCGKKYGVISYRGFCQKCSLDAKVAGGRLGGRSGTGDAKRRLHQNNGRFLPRQQDYKSWKSLDISIRDFEILLQRLHEGREYERKRPWLRASNLPSSASSIYNIADIVDTMCNTRFCHLDRFKDAVSKEITYAMRQATSKHWRIAISLGVRYAESPRGLATALAKTATAKDFKEKILSCTRSRVYRQSGIPTANLSGLLAVSSELLRHKTFKNFDCLEDYIASRMTRHCHGSKNENFSARQVALDICAMKSMCHGLDSRKRPHVVRLGPGAKAGFYLKGSG